MAPGEDCTDDGAETDVREYTGAAWTAGERAVGATVGPVGAALLGPGVLGRAPGQLLAGELGARDGVAGLAWGVVDLGVVDTRLGWFGATVRVDDGADWTGALPVRISVERLGCEVAVRGSVRGAPPGEACVAERVGTAPPPPLLTAFLDGMAPERLIVSVRVGWATRLGAPPMVGLDSSARDDLSAVLGGAELRAVRA